MSNPIVYVQADTPNAVVQLEVANKGKDGYTPKRGVDYWTEEDVQEIHNYVDEQIGASPYAVSSVNGKTGAVMLAPEDIGAQPKGDYALKEELPSVPTRLSQFEQDADHRLTTDAEKDAWNAKSDFSGKYADLEGKPDIPTVPENVSAFKNDVGYLTEHQDLSQYAKKSDIPDTSAFITRAVNDLANYYRKSETYTQDEIDNRISTIPKFSISVVSFLPTQDISDTTIYLVSGDNDIDLYTEYIHVNGAWETLGSQRVDLTDYATQTWTLEQLAGYQPKGEYLTKVPDEYVTEADIDAKGYLTEHQDLSNYALKEDIPQIDDDAVSAESTWSSKNTVERFLPEFSESGSVVECHPFPMCPLDVSTTFEPAQAGSGDPYPAGGGEQLLPFAFAGNTASVSGITATFDNDGCVINGTPTTDYVLPFGVAEISLTPGTYYISGGESPKVYMQIKIEREGENLFYHNDSFEVRGDETAIKYMVQIGTAANVGTLTNYRVKPMLVKGTKAPAEYKSYSNIRPISGHDSLSLTRCGKNLLPFPYYRMSVTAEGVTYSASSDGGITSSGTSTGYSALTLYEGAALSEGVYTLSLTGNYGGIYISIEFFDDNWNHKATLQHAASITFSTDDYQYQNWKILFKRSNNGVTVSGTAYPQLELGSTVTPYEPYRGNTYTVHLGQTVYGGTYDWSKGELMSEWAHMRMADQNWTASTSKPGRFSINAVGAYARRVAPMCNIMPGWPGLSSDLRYTLMNNEGDQLIVNTDFTSLDQFIAWLDENDAYMCYKPAAPITIQLAPLEIMPINGANVLLSNPDDTTVSGKLDPIYLHEENKATVAKLMDMETRLRALESAAVNNA